MEPSPVSDLKRRLIEQGPMSVDEFMAWCLTDQSSAYYRTGNPLGASGDFVTAPEVSQIFGELIAVWAVSVWRTMGMPKPFILAELGPGRGTLMQDALRAARVMPQFLEAADVHLVETSAPLREKQGQALAQYCQPCWHENVGELPDGPLIVIANEFFDALPVRQHIFHDGSWHKRMVTITNSGALSFSLGRQEAPPIELLPAHPPCNGDILESRPALPVIVGEFGRRAKSVSVALIVADYGYESHDYGDTLQAVKSHGYADPLEAPGEADLSAHVNFAGLAQAAEAEKLQAWGPLTQSSFLISLGIEQRLRQLMASAKEEQRTALFLGARRLIDPYQMGNLFKVMSMTSSDLPAPLPFTKSVALQS